MHIVIGGSANGKRKFVREMMPAKTIWFGDEAPLELMRLNELPDHQSAVICNVEEWMATQLDDEEKAIHDLLNAILGKNVTFIITDIGRGIVPMDARERALRDACGRLNQHLMKVAEGVTRIWYGIPQKLK
ncbi:bifunctional adenosylcobinamide kinase/adenosylcobinamide-phosphate guanylyltransferase [Sporosarcina sp. D27]|uniref:bifunctional adenosylcobinamide kinase/adenosylcobinamide-phosphate guanylyltransferase n=1 Tax=Sporosarcina sp. D27 TaxID=1382305 RepID=UPI00046F724B|nr:bifunctional adenosylcobinamide kinase/adenosylcobinamide-phosphate guanylyltransferase [Sporosarcina sp. D27]